MKPKPSRRRLGRQGGADVPAPFPPFMEPALATLVQYPPQGDDWVHEIKLDGYRLQVQRSGDNVRVLTRRGEDWTHRFPGITRAVRALSCKSAWLDGEAVVVDAQGRSDFRLLVEDLKSGRRDRIVLYAFDLLGIDGQNLTAKPLLDRKARLAQLVRESAAENSLHYCDHIAGDGASLAAKACELGLEGIVSKRTDKPYRSGRHGHWTKVKCVLTDEFVICGYLASNPDPRAVGALVLGYHAGSRLVYAGRAGTGFTHQMGRRLKQQLDELAQTEPPFSARLRADQRRGVVWVRPVLVAQVAYRGWTSDGLLRQAAFKGLREDKPAQEVVDPRATGDGAAVKP